MGIAALILGILSIIIAFIPLCGTIAFLPALIGLILGIVEIVKKSKNNEKKGMGIAGTILSGLALIIIFFWLVVFGAGVAQSAGELVNSINDIDLNEVDFNEIYTNY